MKYEITTIPHTSQRYETAGDYLFTDKGIEIFVSDTKNEDYNFLIGLHELVEAYICQKRGITDDEITDFDINFKGKGEPGDSKFAPYVKEHKFATKIEKIMCKELGISWKDYDKAVDKL